MAEASSFIALTQRQIPFQRCAAPDTERQPSVASDNLCRGQAPIPQRLKPPVPAGRGDG